MGGGLVAPEHRPTLREALARAPRGARVALAAGVLLVVVAAAVAAWLALRSPGVRVVRSAPVAFHFRHPAALRERPARAGELVRLEQHHHGRLVAELVVSPLRLAPYRGDVSGALPLAADRELTALSARFPGLRLVQEGRAQLGDLDAYALSFRIGHRRFGRDLLIPRPGAGARDGVRLLLVDSRSGEVNGASDVGLRGHLTQPYDTFGFGT